MLFLHHWVRQVWSGRVVNNYKFREIRLTGEKALSCVMIEVIGIVCCYKMVSTARNLLFMRWHSDWQCAESSSFMAKAKHGHLSAGSRLARQERLTDFYFFLYLVPLPDILTMSFKVLWLMQFSVCFHYLVFTNILKSFTCFHKSSRMPNKLKYSIVKQTLNF